MVVSGNYFSLNSLINKNMNVLAISPRIEISDTSLHQTVPADKAQPFSEISTENMKAINNTSGMLIFFVNIRNFLIIFGICSYLCTMKSSEYYAKCLFSLCFAKQNDISGCPVIITSHFVTDESCGRDVCGRNITKIDIWHNFRRIKYEKVPKI